MRHQKITWRHDLDDEPVTLYSEVDEDGAEVRKVDIYRDGRMDLADAGARTGSARLSETQMPSMEEINAQEEFTAESITKDAFQGVREVAQRWFADPS